MSVKIEMYTKIHCPYCVKAKNFLAMKGFTNISEYNIELDLDKRDEMLKRTNGAKTVPQIFINSKLIGGCDDMLALDAKGKLNDILRLK